MEPKGRSPFDGKPTTTETKDEQGLSTYTVTLSAMTPFRARIADKLALGASIATGIGAIRLAFELTDPTTAEVLALLATPLPAYWAVLFVLYHLMQKSVRVVFTPEHFVIERLVRSKRFDRNLPHGFTLHVHDHARREEEKLVYREGMRRKFRWPWPAKRYLGHSYHLSFEYLDQRNDIMTVYRRKHAYRCSPASTRSSASSKPRREVSIRF